jgi:hypothetical protein
MKQSKSLFLLLAFALIALVVPAASAQEPTYGLSEADFAAYTDALANSSSQTDFTFSYSGNFDTLTGEGTNNITFSGEGALSGGSVQLTMAGDMNDPSGMKQSYATELRVIGDMFYIDVTGFMGSWISAGPEDLETVGQMAGPMLGAGSTDMTDPSALMTQPGMMDAFAALQDIDPESFTSIVRSDEGGLAVYTTTIDLGTLMENEGIQQLFIMGASQGAAAGGGAGLTDEQLQELPALLADSTITLAHRINPSSNLVEGFNVVLSLPIDPSVISGAPSEDPLTITITLDVTIGGYGTTTEIVAPEGAMPLSQMLQGFMSGMSS